MNKKILIHSIVFSPDGVSTAYIYNDIALKFKESGYEVVVLTTTPHYNAVESELKKQPLRKKAFGLYYESDFHGIKVKHVYQKKFKSTILRLLGFVYWHIVSFIIALFEKRVDLILSPSPPLTIGFLNILISKIKRSKVIYNVQEIYPDLLVEEGGLKSKTGISLLKWMEKYVYNHSDGVTTIDQVFYNTIAPRFKNKSKLHIIPNFVDTEIYKPLSKEKLELNKELFPNTDSLKVMYAGNIGHAQDWKPLIAVAEVLKYDPVDFFVIGEGVEKEALLSEKENRKLDKLHILPYQPRELMPSLLTYSDVHFIFMASRTEGHGFPSKVYTIMACAKPLIVISGENTPIINFLKGKDCAFLFNNNNLSANVNNIANILKNTSTSIFEGMGKNGLSIIHSDYSKDIVTEKYIKLVKRNIMNILITGINGFVGSNLTKSWGNKFTLFGLDINQRKKEGVEKVFSWDEMDNISNMDAFIHLAGKAHDTKEKSHAKEYFDINTGLTKRIFDYFLNSDASTFIFFSSVKAAADKVPGDSLTEDVVPAPIGPYGESKIKAEDYILSKQSEAETKNKRVYIIRPCMIHGPGNKGNLNLLYNLVKKGIPWPLGSFNNKRSFCSIDNIVFVIEQLITKDNIPSGIYHMADDEPLSTNLLIKLISDSVGKNPHIWNVPKGLMKGSAAIGGSLHLPLNKERLSKLTENYVVSNEKIKNALGINKMPVSALEGMIKTLKSFK